MSSRIFQPILSDPETVRIPGTAVPDETTAAAISVLGDAAMGAYKGHARADLRGKLTDLSDEAIDTAEAEVFGGGEEEVIPAEVDYVGRQMQLLARAKTSGTTSDSGVKIRAERLLREAINRNPGLAPEFKMIAQDTLGYNPLGAELDAMTELQAAASEQSTKIYETYVAQAKSWNLPVHLLHGNSQEQRLFFEMYNRMENDQREVARLKDQVTINNANAENLQRSGRQLLAADLRVQIPSLRGRVDRMLRLKDEEGNVTNLAEAGANTILTLSTQGRARIVNDLQALRDDYTASYTSRALEYGIPTGELEALLRPIHGMVDNYIAMLDPSANHKELMARNDALFESARARVYGEEDMVHFEAMGTILRNLPEGTAQQVYNKLVIGSDLSNAVARAWQNLDGGQPMVPPPTTEMNIEARKAILIGLPAAVRSWSVEGDPAAGQAIYESALGVARHASSLGTEAPNDLAESLLEVFSEKDINEKILNRFDEGGFLRDQLANSVLPIYAERLAESIAASVPHVTTRGTRLNADGTREVNPRGAADRRIPTAEVFYLDISNPEAPTFRYRPEFENQSFTGGQLGFGDRTAKVLNDMNRTYSQRIGKAIRAEAHIAQVDYSVVAERYLNTFFPSFTQEQGGDE